MRHVALPAGEQLSHRKTYMNDSSLDLIWQLTRLGVSPEAIVDQVRGRGFRELPTLLYNIGSCYLTGRGVKTSLPDAWKWLGMSAAEGSLDALALLGRLHFEGVGCDRSESEAIRFLSQAAYAGHAEAFYSKVSFTINATISWRRFAILKTPRRWSTPMPFSTLP
jgi:TPR repeat protein